LPELLEVNHYSWRECTLKKCVSDKDWCERRKTEDTSEKPSDSSETPRMGLTEQPTPCGENLEASGIHKDDQGSNRTNKDCDENETDNDDQLALDARNYDNPVNFHVFPLSEDLLRVNKHYALRTNYSRFEQPGVVPAAFGAFSELEKLWLHGTNVDLKNRVKTADGSGLVPIFPKTLTSLDIRFDYYYHGRYGYEYIASLPSGLTDLSIVNCHLDWSDILLLPSGRIWRNLQRIDVSYTLAASCGNQTLTHLMDHKDLSLTHYISNLGPNGIGISSRIARRFLRTMPALQILCLRNNGDLDNSVFRARGDFLRSLKEFHVSGTRIHPPTITRLKAVSQNDSTDNQTLTRSVGTSTDDIDAPNDNNRGDVEQEPDLSGQTPDVGDYHEEDGIIDLGKEANWELWVESWLAMERRSTDTNTLMILYGPDKVKCKLRYDEFALESSCSALQSHHS
jgi:hypothetical protein